MAYLDPERGALVLRLIYDGPARSGKTTSLRSLGQILRRRVISPGEADGRTLLFDWLEYTGGRFEGAPIHCQVVAVPGQRQLAARRRALLATADAVVLVTDSTTGQMGRNKAWLERLQEELSLAEPLPVGLIIQANKRDQPEAATLENLRETFGIGRQAALIESVAPSGQGIREAFVFGVRLGIDRARGLREAGLLPTAQPDIDSSDELLESLRRLEAPENQEEAGWLAAGVPFDQESETADAFDAETATTPADPSSPAPSPSWTNAPPLPSAELEPGQIWPPVHGRMTLHEALASQPALRSEPGGSWVAEGDTWTMRSGADQIFDDLASGKQALLAEARRRIEAKTWLSSDRCLAVVQGPTGQSWLWEVLRRGLSLADLLRGAERSGLPGEVANRLFRAARLLARAGGQFPTGGGFPSPSLETLGLEDGRPVFLDFLTAGPFAPTPPLLELLRRELTPHTRDLAIRVGELGWIEHRLDELGGPDDQVMIGLLRELITD